MFELPTDALRRAVEIQHGGTATFVKAVPVYEVFKWQTVWNGAVQVFDLLDSPSGATRAYAWSAGLPDGSRRSVVILHGPPVTGPKEAVRAAVAADRKAAS